MKMPTLKLRNIVINMVYTHNQIQNLKLPDFEKLLGRLIKITFQNPINLKGYEEEQIEIVGKLIHIFLSPIEPYLPVEVTIKNGKGIENNINIFKMDKLELE